jgi:hypothetical protein
MIRLTSEEILELGKKHKKWNEAVTVEIFPYVISNSPYFLAYYHGKFSTKTREVAIVSPNSSNKEHAYKALKPLLYFTVTFNNLDIGTRKRAELQFDVMHEINDYLRSVLLSGELKQDLVKVYQRSLDITDEIIILQDKMLELRKEVNAIAQGILDRGYIADEDINNVFELFPTTGWIQYNQFYKNYIYRSDFDVIYENSSSPELKPFHKFKDEKTLFNMTSKIAERRLKESLEIATDGQDMSNFSKEDYFSYWSNKFKKDLSDRYEELRNKIRYPK